jgi:hypothetical protein
MPSPRPCTACTTRSRRIDAEAFLDRFDLDPGERQRVTQLRRLFAAFWVMRLLPGGSAYRRNPPGTFEHQASRLLDLLSLAG